METREEMIKIVEKLNDEIFDKLDVEMYDHDVYFEFRTVGNMDTIYFITSQIWSSEDDYRDSVNEGTNEEDYEPLEDFLRRRVIKLIAMLNKLNFDYV